MKLLSSFLPTQFLVFFVISACHKCLADSYDSSKLSENLKLDLIRRINENNQQRRSQNVSSELKQFQREFLGRRNSACENSKLTVEELLENNGNNETTLQTLLDQLASFNGEANDAKNIVSNFDQLVIN